MDLLIIPTSKWHQNPLYPLPAEYEELGPQEQRLARVNAVRQWTVTPEQATDELRKVHPLWGKLDAFGRQVLVNDYLGTAFKAAVNFFDMYYLMPDLETDFNPGFYGDTVVPHAAFHDDILWDLGVYDSNLEVAPRGSSKTTTLRRMMMATMLSRDNTPIFYCTSSDRNTAETADIMRDQLYRNPRIQDDWRAEMPTGRIKPNRGELRTGIEAFALGNRSRASLYSASAKIRGGRPFWFVLDDPEYDPSASTSMANIRANMNRLIFSVAMPMVMTRAARIVWTATFISKRHFAWMAAETEPQAGPDGKIIERCRIPEFDYWNRRIVLAAKTDASGELVSCWPHMWPINAEERTRLRLPVRTKTLVEIRSKIGAAAFAAEFMAQPGTGESVFFEMKARDHGWSVLKTSIDDHYANAPWKSTAIIQWMVGDTSRESTLKDLLARCKLFIVSDTSKTHNQGSDFKVNTLMGLDPEQNLFVFDMWAGKKPLHVQSAQALDMARKWHCPKICPEMIDDGITLARMMQNTILALSRLGGQEFLPSVKGFSPGFASKSAKIAALHPRVERGQLKLPFHLRMRRPWFDLFEQFEGFNPDANDCGLQHDDHLDTVSMSEFVTGARSRKKKDGDGEGKTVMELLKGGMVIQKETGMPLIGMLDLSKISLADLEKIRQAQLRPANEQRSLM